MSMFRMVTPSPEAKSALERKQTSHWIDFCKRPKCRPMDSYHKHGGWRLATCGGTKIIPIIFVWFSLTRIFPIYSIMPPGYPEYNAILSRFHPPINPRCSSLQHIAGAFSCTSWHAHCKPQSMCVCVRVKYPPKNDAPAPLYSHHLCMFGLFRFMCLCMYVCM